MSDRERHFGCGRPVLWAVVAICLGMPLSCAMVLSSMDQAKRAPRVAHCASNLKWIGTALLMYVQDYDERLPPAAYQNGAVSVTLPSLLHPYILDEKVWECPTARLNGARNQTYDLTPGDRTTSYGYNGHSLAPKGKGVRLSQVRKPAATVAFLDSESPLAIPGALQGVLDGTLPAYRHPQSDAPMVLNVGYVDGHVKRERRDKLELMGHEEGGKHLKSGIDSFLYWNLQ